MVAVPSERILLVEDEAHIRDSARDLLTDEGYEVTTSVTLHGARTALTGGAFACLVLDLRLPDGAGEDLLRELIQQAVAPPVVVISTANDASNVAREYGVLALAKPFELELLIAAVKIAVSQRMRPSLRTPRDAATVRMRPIR